MISRIRPAAGASSPAINRRHSETIHKSVRRRTLEIRAGHTQHRRHLQRRHLHAAIYNNLTAYNLISIAVWVCGRIDLEKSNENRVVGALLHGSFRPGPLQATAHTVWSAGSAGSLGLSHNHATGAIQGARNESFLYRRGSGKV